MSEISLTTYIVQDPEEPINKVILDNVNLVPAEIEGALVTLYGLKQSTRALSEVRRQASKRWQLVYTVTINVEIGYWTPMLASWELLPQIHFLNIERARIDVQNEMARYLRQTGVDAGDGDKPFTQRLMENPGWIAKLREHPRFNHIDLWMFPYQHDGKLYSLAALFNGYRVSDIRVRGEPDFEVALPSRIL